MKRIVIVGATSGIGLEVARLCLREGWQVGAAGRRADALAELQAEAPEQVSTEVLDITREDAPQHLDALIQKLGGMDIYFHASGIGSRNTELKPEIEIATLRTNGEGFVRMVTAAYGWFCAHSGGHNHECGHECVGGEHPGGQGNSNGGNQAERGENGGNQAERGENGGNQAERGENGGNQAERGENGGNQAERGENGGNQAERGENGGNQAERGENGGSGDGRSGDAQEHKSAHSGGHIAVISSIAGTKGLGSAPAYSATKRMQNTYIDALAQLSRMEGCNIRFTDIRPGFVDTPLLRDGHYPMLMPVDKVARQILRALKNRRRRIVIDRRYAVMVFFWKLIPQWLWERLSIRSKA